MLRTLPLIALTIVASQAQAASISGNVVSTILAMPMQGVMVTLALAPGASAISSVRTDASGEFVFSDIAKGSYSLSAQAPGFANLTVSSIDVAEDQKLALPPLGMELGGMCSIEENRISNRTFLADSTAAIDGVVRNSRNVPIAGVRVVLVRDRRLVAQSRSDEHGAFRFSEIEPATYWLRIRRFGYRPIEAKLANIPVHFAVRNDFYPRRCPAFICALPERPAICE
jgi:hypothetical protein